MQPTVGGIIPWAGYPNCLRVERSSWEQASKEICMHPFLSALDCGWDVVSC